MERPASGHRLLLAAACSWESTVPLAIALRDAGFAVAIVAPRGHPLHAVPGLTSRWIYRSLAPASSLLRAIDSVAPSVIMPCDEPVMLLLQQLRRSENLPAAVCEAIERALGPATMAPLLVSRPGLDDIGAATGVPVPEMAEISSLPQLLAWLRSHGLPAYLKIDRSTGGRGVVRVASMLGAAMAFLRLRLLFGFPRTLWLWLRWRDLSTVALLRMKVRAAITVQKAIEGMPANCAFAAWRGELRACIAAEALETRTPTGVATVIRVRDDAKMDEMARKVTGYLGLSGLHGLDFILARDTGVPWLIEINGRPTQTAYLRLGARADLAGALYAAVTDTAIEPVGVFMAEEVITLFEQPSGATSRASESRVAQREDATPLPLDLHPAADTVVLSP